MMGRGMKRMVKFLMDFFFLKQTKNKMKKKQSDVFRDTLCIVAVKRYWIKLVLLGRSLISK